MKKHLTLIFISFFIKTSITFGQNTNFIEQNIPDVVIEPATTPFQNYSQASNDTADIDNDGDLDLVISGNLNGQGKLTVFFNDGSGNFIPGQSFLYTFTGYGTVKFNDVDNDGDMDIIDWNDNHSDSQLNVYLNNGTGQFSLSNSQQMSGSAFFKTGDFNNDGYTDLINVRYDHLTIHFNNQHGGFDNPLTTSVFYPRQSGFEIVDYNNDSYDDICVTRSNNFHLKIYINNQQNGFISYMLRGFPDDIYDFKFANLDNDASLEIITYQSNKIAIYDFIQDYNYGLAYEIEPVNINSFTPIYDYDFNNDGLKDFFILNGTSTKIFMNNGNLSFTINNIIDIYDNGNPATLHGSACFGDFNNDGNVEILASWADTRLFINQNGRYLHNGSHKLKKMSKSFMEFADFDGDNLKDLFVIGQYNRKDIFRIYKNNDTSFDPIPIVDFDFAVVNNSDNKALVFDADNDNDNDIIIMNDDHIKFYHNDGYGHFTNSLNGLAIYEPLNSYGSLSLYAVDIDGDGDKDVVENGRIIFINDGNGNFTQNIDIAYSSYLKFIDINNDGLPDILDDEHIYRNNGNFSFTDIQDLLQGEQHSYTTYTIIDINNDGYKDIIISAPYSINAKKARMFINDGNEHFVEDVTNITPANIDAVHLTNNHFQVIDFDHDGDEDIIGIENYPNHSKSFLLINLNGTLYKFIDRAFTDIFGDTKVDSYKAIDYNDDGLYDLLEPSSNDDNLHLMINNSLNTVPLAIEVQRSDIYIGFQSTDYTIDFEDFTTQYFPDFANGNMTYYTNKNDAVNQQNALPTTFNLTVDDGYNMTLYAHTDVSPDYIFKVKIVFKYFDFNFNSVEICDIDEDGVETVDFDKYINLLSTNQNNINSKYYGSLTDAQNDTNSISNQLPIGTYHVWARITDQESGYYLIKDANIAVRNCPVYNNYNYDVTRIPYSLYNIPNSVEITENIDDSYSSVINLQFPFDFYGITYQHIAFADNGCLSFNAQDVKGYCRWEFNDHLPSIFLPKNHIFGIYQDIRNDGSNNQHGTIGYGQVGTAPFRKFIAFYDNVPLFDCSSTKMTTQIVLYETYDFIDVQVDERTHCSNWNRGHGVLGVQNINGYYAAYPPHRNTGTWDADDEAWRFRPNYSFPDFQYIICDVNVDGIETFDANYILSHYNTGGSGVIYSLHLTEDDAINNLNPVNGTFQNSTNAQTVYVRVEENGNVTTKRVLIAAIDCSADYDIDGVPTATEDINGNGNFGDDDTDGDGIPDFVDDDDDGDMILTNIETVFSRSDTNLNYTDTDGDGIPNYLDNDDDGDGVLTIDEDYDGDSNPLNDDVNNDGIPDYLQNIVTNELVQLSNKELKIYPNPTNNNINLSFAKVMHNVTIRLFSADGKELSNNYYQIAKQLRIQMPREKGIYLIKVISADGVAIRRIIKK